LSFKISHSLGGNEEGTDRSIGIISPEVSASAIESGNNAVRAPRLKNIRAHPRVPKLLGHLQILLFGYPSELAAVFLEVIVQQMFGTEARTSREHQAS
jgi:hypothetical protein